MGCITPGFAPTGPPLQGWGKRGKRGWAATIHTGVAGEGNNAGAI